MEFKLLADVVEELSAHVTGARLERVFEGSGGHIYFLLRRERKNFILLLSPDRTLPRLHLVSAKPKAELNPCSFVLYLRSHLTGACIDVIALENQDRVVIFRFTKMKAEYCLIFELFGASANIILTDSASIILAVYYARLPALHVERPLVPGSPYTLPEKRSLQSPGRPVRLTEYHGTNDNVLAPNRKAELFYQHHYEQKKISSLRTTLSFCIQKSLAKIERRVSALSEDLMLANRAEEYKQAGNLILSNLGSIRTGMTLVNLAGYDGETVALPLNPKITPSRNADRYFKKYKKAKTGHAIIKQRLRQADEETLLVKGLQARCDRAEDLADLDSIRSKLATGGYIRGEIRGRVHPGPASPGYRRIMFRDWDILVGKGAAGNDHISTKIACPDDVWLHAEDMPGSHVLIKNPGRGDVPLDVLSKAAALAAYYSKGKNADKVSVTYTHARHVKKPKGAKPGLVTLKERRSIMVRPAIE